MAENEANSNKSEALSDREKEALKFLDRDFNQCFQQMRHYDSQIFEICKFSFGAYSGILATAIGLHQFSLKEHHDFGLTIASILGTGCAFGLLFFGLIVRNRVYFVQVARYINEQRDFFFALKPLGFSNQSRMYRSPTPPFFSPRSSQSWFMYMLALLNGILAFTFLIFVTPLDFEWKVVIALAFILLQLVFAICYLNYREDKSAETAVWGEGRS